MNDNSEIVFSVKICGMGLQHPFFRDVFYLKNYIWYCRAFYDKIYLIGMWLFQSVKDRILIPDRQEALYENCNRQ